MNADELRCKQIGTFVAVGEARALWRAEQGLIGKGLAPTPAVVALGVTHASHQQPPTAGAPHSRPCLKN